MVTLSRLAAVRKDRPMFFGGRLVISTSLWLALLTLWTPATAATGRSALISPPLPRIPRFLGPSPRNCPVASPHFIHRSRSGPPIVWIGSGLLVGYSGWQVVNHRLMLGFGARTEYGFPQKIFWQLARTMRGSVRLRGWNLRTGQRIWFGRPLPAANSAVSSPPPVIAWPSAVIFGRHAPTLTFVPEAGCYVLQARWHGGGWSVPFTA
jgi:hypothetical protein